MPIRVLIWNEGRHEQTHENVRAVYPDGMHGALAAGLAQPDFVIRTATLDDPDQGLAELENTDVLFWWGHGAHSEVTDENARRVAEAVHKGMGFIALHSGHHSKPFRALMGTTCNLSWREMGEHERLWVIDPTHPICAGLSDSIYLPHEEMYSERFDIPTPDELLMIGWFAGGEVFRSACTFRRGYGKIFYFQPGHETYPTYHMPEIHTVLKSAVRWAAPTLRAEVLDAPCVEPREEALRALYKG